MLFLLFRRQRLRLPAVMNIKAFGSADFQFKPFYFSLYFFLLRFTALRLRLTALRLRSVTGALIFRKTELLPLALYFRLAENYFPVAEWWLSEAEVRSRSVVYIAAETATSVPHSPSLVERGAGGEVLPIKKSAKLY